MYVYDATLPIDVYLTYLGFISTIKPGDIRCILNHRLIRNAHGARVRAVADYTLSMIASPF
jgi:hypothetical protein